MKDLSEECREVPGTRLKDGVYHAAAEILRREGYKSLTMNRIADQVGVSRTTLYNHFADATDLYIFVEDRIIQSLLVDVTNIAGSSRSAPKRIIDVANSIVDRVQSDRALTLALFRRPDSLSKRTDRWIHTRKGMMRALHGIVTEGIESGEFDEKTNPQAGAGVLLSTMKGLVEVQLILNITDKHMTSDVMNLILRGLLPRYDLDQV